jgi:hypothetical protein
VVALTHTLLLDPALARVGWLATTTVDDRVVTWVGALLARMA